MTKTLVALVTPTEHAAVWEAKGDVGMGAWIRRLISENKDYQDALAQIQAEQEAGA